MTQHKDDTHRISAVQQMWRQRMARDAERDEAEAARKAEYDKIWGEPARRDWHRFHEAHNGRKLTNDELKARQAAWTAEAPTRQQAARDLEQFRRRVSEKLSQADRDVDRMVATAHAQGMSDEDVETYVSAHARAAALRSLVNRLATADDKAAAAFRQSVAVNRGLARV